MAYLAVDKDGSEWIWQYKPLRNKMRGEWESVWDEDGAYQHVELPKGTIEKLIGWEMSWDHEPYLMEE